MNSIRQVEEIIEEVKASGIPLSEAAWQTALACVGWPYVFGAWGEECTPSGRRRRAREDHPTIVSKCQVLSGKKAVCDGCKWDLPVRMFDCRGFTDWVLKQFGIDLQGEGATSQWNSDNWEAKGTIDTVPDGVLVCLFVKDGQKMSHTGFGYNGASCECSSGVQYFAQRKNKWTHWAVPRGIGGEIPDYKPTLRRGSKGEYVYVLQTMLQGLGYDIGKTGVDGDYGKATEKAVKAFQKDHGLTADGVCGPLTWKALMATGPAEPEPEKLYTVTIPHLPKAEAEILVKEYEGAAMAEERG